MKQLELFFWGIIAALGALFVELFLMFATAFYRSPSGALNLEFSANTLPIMIIFVLVEEAFKYLIIAKKIEPLSLEYSFIFNSLLMGTGFATMEMALIAYQDQTVFGNPYGLLKIAIVHVATAGIMGYLTAIRGPRRAAAFCLSLLTAASLHLVYNLLAFNEQDFAFADQAIAALLILLVLINVLNLFKLPKKLAS